MRNQSENDDQTKKIAAEAAGKEVNLKEFLSCFYSEDETVFIRLFADKKDKDLPAQEFFPRLNKIDEFIPKLKVLNNQGYGVFFSVNGERVDKDVTKIRAQFFECDDISIEQQLENIKTFPLQPSIIVRTRKSLHVYFLIENGKVEAFRTIQKKLAQQFHGDKTVINESRVMRILGYNHCKQEPFMVECLSFNPQIKYTQEELEAYQPELEEIKPSEATTTAKGIEYKKGTKEQLDFLVDNCDFIKHCKEHAAFLPEIDWYSMVTNLALFEGGKEKIHELSNCYPRYSEFETDQKIEHFLNSGTAPMNCKIIAEKGYVCPCIGSCACKSPAGLPFSAKTIVKIPEWYEASKTGSLRLMSGVLANYLFENVRCLYVGERFHVYKDGVYSEISDYEAQRIIREHLLEDKVKTFEINDVISQWKMLIYKDTNEINTDINVINLKNGLYNINTNELLPHTPDYLSTIGINADYDNNADCLKFKAFLNEVLEPELIPYVQMIFGYCCTMHMEAQLAFIFKGIARSGKSTIIKIIEALVGIKNFSNVPWQNLGDRFNTATLFGKILNTFSDLPSRAIEDSSIFKALTSPDMLQVERKGKDPFQFLPFCKLLFSTNEMPLTLGDKGQGYYRRISIVRFERQIPEDKINPNIVEELLQELDGIFNWAMQGLEMVKVLKYKFPRNKIVDEELFKYKYASNNVLAFVEDECEFADSYQVLKTEFYEYYKYICGANGLRAMSKNNFNNELEQNYKDKIKEGNDSESRRCIWKGIRLIEDKQKMEEELLDNTITALNPLETLPKDSRRYYID